MDVRLTPDGTKFVLVGQRAGSSSLLFIKNDGTQINWVINVFSRSPELVERELTQLLEGYPGLRVRRVGARLFIEGGVSNKAEQRRATQIAQLYPGQVKSLVTVGTGAIDRKLNIRVDFFFVQYTKTSSWQIGISWPGHYGGSYINSEVDFNFLTKSIGPTASASIVNQPLPGLESGQRAGLGQGAQAGHGHHHQRQQGALRQRRRGQLPDQHRARGRHREDPLRHQRLGAAPL